MADDDSGGQYFDPAATLTPDDPLRDSSVDQWIAKVQQDHPDIAGQLLTDPSAAVKALADRGVTPPPMSYAASDTTGSASPLDAPVPNTGPHGIPPTSPFGRLGIGQTPIPPGQTPDPTAAQGPYIMDKGPATGVTPAGSTPPPGVPLPTPRPVVGASALDPEEGEVNPNPVAPGTVPLPTAKPTDTDVSAKKKEKTGDSGMGDFAKTLAGVKALQPPPNAAVGTPSVHSALAMKSPDITQLLALFGQQAGAATPASTLGRLLVAGKA